VKSALRGRSRAARPSSRVDRTRPAATPALDGWPSPRTSRDPSAQNPAYSPTRLPLGGSGQRICWAEVLSPRVQDRDKPRSAPVQTGARGYLRSHGTWGRRSAASVSGLWGSGLCLKTGRAAVTADESAKPWLVGLSCRRCCLGDPPRGAVFAGVIQYQTPRAAVPRTARRRGGVSYSIPTPHWPRVRLSIASSCVRREQHGRVYAVNVHQSLMGP
jgi:hypothetical protein